MKYSAETIRYAAERGVDLVNGQHNPIAAEGARRAGLELLRFPDWTGEQLQAWVRALDGFAEEMGAASALCLALGEALEAHGAAKVRLLPPPVLVSIFGCTEDELPDVLSRELPRPWWWTPGPPAGAEPED